MNLTAFSVSRSQYWDYFILVSRFLLAWMFFSYGSAKLFDSQFGITEAEMATAVQDMSLFRLSWFLFDHEPFKTFIGISQVVCAALLIINRTAILGALMFIPIVVNILIIDMTFMHPALAQGFMWRLSGYLILDLLILWHYKGRMLRAWHAITYNLRTKFRFPIWAYLILPILAFILEFALVIPKVLFNLITRPAATIEAWSKLPALIQKVFENVQ